MHTPGPWEVRYEPNLTAICTPKGEFQVSLFSGKLNPRLSVGLHEWKANARLIAAAPELLEAAKDAEIQMDLAAELLTGLGDVWAREKAEQLSSCAVNIRNAIARAEGRET